jgi:presequence protease
MDRKSATKSTNPTIPGYRLIEKRFVREVNAACYFLQHIQSGARVLKIAAKDPNKTFCIAFKTLPDSDNGAPHILEHSVLNGSGKFPVKSPFDILIKGSLSTFMNAFTSKDFTMFPVASMNVKDYFNLMHVYLDAVFNPLFVTDARILKQEGWHYELPGKYDPVVIKGVVYNEMKGAFSSPVRELAYQVCKSLFPGHGYGYESGGYPAAIPSLKQDGFIRFYRRYYHPENSYVFLYGDGEMEKELCFIDREYLSKYRKQNRRAEITDQAPFDSMRKIRGHYPILDGVPVENQTYLSLNFVAGQCIDRELSMTLDLFCEVLVNQESAPVRLALQNAGIGKDVTAYTDNLKQNIVRIIVQNANSGEEECFKKTVFDTIRDALKEGLDRNEIRGVLNRMEFQLREGNDAQKGLTAIFQSQPGFFFAGDPFMGMEYETPLANLKKAIKSNAAEKTIRKHILNNPHAVLLSLEPKPGLEKKRNDELTGKLKKYKESLSPSAVETLVKETKELIRHQKREDTAAALATIPMLDLADINPSAVYYQAEENRVDGIKVLSFGQFTNKVVYANYYFDLKVLPEKMIPYASLLSNVIGLLDTDKYSYGKLNQQLNIYTGGFFSSLTSFLERQDDNHLIPKFQVTIKALNNRLDKLFELTGEILLKTEYSDTDRLGTLLSRHQSQLEAMIKERGNKYTSVRLSSYFNNQGMFNELSGGLEYYWFVTDLVKNFSEKKNEIAANLKNTAEILFTQKNLIASVTGTDRDRGHFLEKLADFLGRMPAEKSRHWKWAFNLEKRNEGILTPSKVQYVTEGYNFKKLGYSWDGKMRVLDHILTTDWLQKQIRVIGGAYGGYCSITPGGFITFNSYRDPNLKETLDNFRKTIEYLDGFDADEKSMTRYIIGTIAALDHPMTNSQQGDLAVSYYFSKRTKQEIQRDRNAILATTPADIRKYVPMIRDILEQKAFCVYGDAAKIESEKKLFNRLIRIEK